MILLLDTSTPVCKVWLYKERECVVEDTWEAGRGLAEGILRYVTDKLSEVGADWHDITGIGVFRGPGSFTGLRIGIAVCNALAHDQHVPIVGTTGDMWREQALKRLKGSEDDKVVIPEYGRDARITQPKK